MSAGWNGRRVLVTGADGFIGSHVTEALVMAGAHVRAFCFYNSNGSLGWLENMNADLRATLDARLGDIRDGRFVAACCDGIEVVFHLAALVAIPYSYVAPESFVATNVYGALNVLEAVRQCGCSRLVHTSTSEVYGTPDRIPIREDHTLKAQSPYSASKIAADKLAESFYCSFGTPVVTLRPFNTYGPRQSTRAVIPTILTQLLAGRSIVKLGNTYPKRDLTFVEDTVRGFLAAGEAPTIEGRVIQLGTGHAVSIAELFEMARTVCGVAAYIETEDRRQRPRESEVMVLQSDPGLARELLAWEPSVSLREGLERTAAWMESHLAQFQPDVYAV